MKNALFTTFLFFVITTILSQENYVTLTNNGFTNSNNPEQQYIVLEFEGKSQKDLYKAFLTHITTTYISAKDVVSSVENETISINSYAPQVVEYRIGRNPATYYNLNHNLSFQFKDHKVRVNLPIINYMTLGANNLILEGDTGLLTNNIAIYKKGTLRAVTAKTSLEKYFNDYIYEIVTAVKSNTNTNW